jgi:hypothetical protein
MSRSKIPSRRPSMITESNQAWFIKMSGCGLQEGREEIRDANNT